MSTAGDIIQASLEMMGVYSPGESVSAADSSRMLDQLNKMMDSWSNESLVTFSILEQSFPLVVGKTRYTIGLTGSPDINATRPIRILQGPGTAYLQDTNSNNYKINVVEQDTWNQIGNRGVSTVSNIPDTLFYDPQMPLGVINIWPAPTSTFTVFFDSYQQLANLANLTTAFSLPPGYEAAIQSNLAVWCSPFFKNSPVSEDVRYLARETKKVIKRTNKRTNLAQFDIGSMGQGSYNVFTDSYNSTGR